MRGFRALVLTLGWFAAPLVHSTCSFAQTAGPLVPRGAVRPSFDCARAAAAPARLICADADLARLDSRLGAAFRARKDKLAPAEQKTLLTEQLAWIRSRNSRCNLAGKDAVPVEVLASAKPCLMTAINERLAALTQTGAPQSSAGAVADIGGDKKLKSAMDLAASRPQALAALRSILPAGYINTPWIHDLQGVSGPMFDLTSDGKLVRAGQLCKPHDCHDNFLAFLVADDGSRAVAATKFDGQAPSFYGAPTTPEMGVLVRLLDWGYNGGEKLSAAQLQPVLERLIVPVSAVERQACEGPIETLVARGTLKVPRDAGMANCIRSRRDVEVVNAGAPPPGPPADYRADVGRWSVECHNGHMDPNLAVIYGTPLRGQDVIGVEFTLAPNISVRKYGDANTLTGLLSAMYGMAHGWCASEAAAGRQRGGTPRSLALHLVVSDSSIGAFRSGTLVAWTANGQDWTYITNEIPALVAMLVDNDVQAARAREAQRQAAIRQQQIIQAKQNARIAFMQKYGVSEFVNADALRTNQFVYGGKTVAVVASFTQMTKADEAQFWWNSQLAFTGSGIPSALFRGQQVAVIAVRLKGEMKDNAPYVDFVGAYLCQAADCSDFF